MWKQVSIWRILVQIKLTIKNMIKSRFGSAKKEAAKTMKTSFVIGSIKKRTSDYDKVFTEGKAKLLSKIEQTNY